MFDRLFINDLDEKELIENAKESERYFGFLYDKYVHQVYRFVRRRVNNRYEVDDIVAEVFMTVATKIKEYDTSNEGQKFTTRLFGIAHFKILHFLKHEIYGHDEAQLTEMDDVGSKTDINNLLTSKQHYDQILAFAQTLPDKQGAIFFLRFVEGYQNKEIANMLDIHEKTVSSTVSLVIKKIQTHIDLKE